MFLTVLVVLAIFMASVYGAYTLFRYLAAKRGPTHEKFPLTPEVTLLICAYNEEERIPHLMENIGHIDYPSDKLRVLFINDNSTDRTRNRVIECASKLPFQVEVLDNPLERGKTNALNFAYTKISTEITVQTDADTLLESQAISALVQNFAEPDVGGANGIIKIVSSQPSGQLVHHENMYRRFYDLWRRGESAIHSISICNGCIIGFRTELLKDVRLESIADDTELLFKLIRKGKRVVYDEQAVAYEIIPTKKSERFIQKMRRSKGLFQVYLKNFDMLGRNIFGKRVYPFVFLKICVLPYVFITGMIIYVCLAMSDLRWLLLLLILLVPKVNTVVWNVILTQFQIALSPFHRTGPWRIMRSSRDSISYDIHDNGMDC